jgi:hypothetical protein
VSASADDLHLPIPKVVRGMSMPTQLTRELPHMALAQRDRLSLTHSHSCSDHVRACA